MQGRQSLLTFLTVTRWSRSTSNFYVLIGQNLTGEFMRKIYAASGNLRTDSWRWQSFVSSCDVLNCLFLLDVQNEIPLLSRLSVIHGWFVYCGFCWQKSLEILFRMTAFSKMSLLTCPCLRRKRVENSQAILEVIYQTWDAVFHHQMNTEKRVENTTRSGVFLTNFEVFHLVMKHCVECLIFLLKQNHFWRRN